MKFITLLLYITIAGICYSENSKFQILGITFNELGFPVDVKVRLHLNIKKNFTPNQLVVGSNIIDTRGLKDLKLIKKTDILSVYEFSLNLKNYDKGSIIHLDDEKGWELLRISGPFIKISDASGFVCIVQSETWKAGFTIGETDNEEFYKKIAPQNDERQK
jgi:hypothetical protein